ncbi:MAG: SigB/SigF/SigG family RNA polymerase sigma factor [Lachnospiraceae bacterium]|jgi:RNA polymerase sporulation-specific sigma factor|nr:SigB/SigF/SigG family RNA polymerase sigma factor [Lachnospiraceae bacterium]MCI8996215.1 SigB/SigF/SigG family RNA polymerase sigma factor [Lachnospiraceae bacterium]MCI9134586.1 SigB/SigF/SigG family RNA polymerase sigma factor [Lachnospiraceae bacterium]
MDRLSELILRSQEGDKSAREQLIEENMGLVHHVARRFFGRGVEAEDLFQIGAIGLMKAIDRFDLQFSVKFSTYAVPMIAGEIKRFLRDDSMIKVSRSLKELAMRAGFEKERFCMREGREPDVQELAKILGVEKEELVQALDSSAEVESLQRTLYQSEGDGFCLLDKMAEAATDMQEETLRKVMLERVLSQLEPRERELILLRFFYDKTQVQVAERMGMTQVQVSRMEKKVLLRMRGMIL